MPHCVIEYSAEAESQLDMPSLLEQAFAAMEQSGLFRKQAIKVRALAYQHYQSALEDQSFVHFSLRILEGRSEQQKTQLSEGLLAKLEPLLSKVHSVSVEVVDMLDYCYAKRVLD